MRLRWKQGQRWVTRLVFCGFAVACVGLGFAESPRDYEAIEILGFYEEPVWYPSDLNNLGVVVGSALVVSGSSACTQPFVWTQETGTTGLGGELDTCGATVNTLNDRGQFVGFVDPPEPSGLGPQMYILEPDGTLRFPSPLEGDSDPSHINNAGQVAFYYRPHSPISSPRWFPYLLDGDDVFDLSLPGAVAGGVSGVNEDRVAVGYLSFEGCWRQGFIWKDGAHTFLGDCEYSVSPAEINNAGRIVGGMRDGSSAPFRAFSSDGMSIQDLGTLGGPSSYATDINEDGWIVGQSTTASSDSEPAREHAFLFSDGVMYDLNELLPSDSPWELTWGRAINNSGQILAAGLKHDAKGDSYGWVFLDPVAPATAEELIEELIDDVEELVEDGELNNGRGRSLIAELQVALWFLEFHNGERIAAIRLELFIKKVEQLLAIDQLDAALGSELLVKARAALQMLQDES